MLPSWSLVFSNPGLMYSSGWPSFENPRAYNFPVTFSFCIISVHPLCISHIPNSFLHFIVDVSIADDFEKSNVLALKYRRKVASFNAKPQQSFAGNAVLIFSNASFSSLVRSIIWKACWSSKAFEWYQGQLKRFPTDEACRFPGSTGNTAVILYSLTLSWILFLLDMDT